MLKKKELSLGIITVITLDMLSVFFSEKSWYIFWKLRILVRRKTEIKDKQSQKIGK